MRALRLLYNRLRPVFCNLGVHRWETLYGWIGQGYVKTSTCVYCGRERCE